MQGMRHGAMGHDAMGRGTHTGADGDFTLGEGIDPLALPEAKRSETLEVQNGSVITLTAGLARKTLGGKSFAFLAYNGQFPGPEIRAPQGATFTVVLQNESGLPTSIHWHGIRLKNADDGAVGLTQQAVAPGESFRYSVTVPDEGTFWYHPHIREDLQQDLGLYGALIVTPASRTAYLPVNREETVFLDDLAVGTDGLPLRYGAVDATHALMGRFGTVMLTNGATEPRFGVERGEVVRYRFLNAASVRTFRVSIPGAEMKLVAGDGSRYERSEFVKSVTLGPSERATVDVLYNSPGRYVLMSSDPSGDRVLARIEASPREAKPNYGLQFSVIGSHRDVVADIAAFRDDLDKPVDHTLRLTAEILGMGGMRGMVHGNAADGIEWEDPMPAMNARFTKADVRWEMTDTATGKSNMDVTLTARVGDRVMLRIINDRTGDHPMQHPMHLHGQRFLVAAMDGKRPDNLVWKDTVQIPAGSTADLLVDVTNPGDWMMHCHIPEHLENGMMSVFRVLP